MKGRKVKLVKVDDPGKFKSLVNVLDVEMKRRARQGLGLVVKKAQIIKPEDEEQLWTTGVLNDVNGPGLLNAIFFKLGLHLALRGGAEHYNLKVHNFTLVNMPNGTQVLEYREDISKSQQGGVKHVKITPKVVRVPEDRSVKERCVVHLFRRYMAACPADRPNAFYLQPIYNPVSSTLFSKQRVGKNKLAGMVGKMMNNVSSTSTERYSNHSLRATAATRLYDAGYDNQAISSVTGHRTRAVEEYKRISFEKNINIQKTIGRMEDHSSTTTTKSNIEGLFRIENNNACTFNINVSLSS